MKTRRYAVIVLRDFTLTVAVSLAAAVACLCTAGPTYAASLGPTGNSAQALAQDIYSPPDGPTIDGSSTPIFDSSQPVTASALATSVTYATAQTSFGVNRAKAYMGGYAPFQAVNSIIAQAGSRWTDQVVITGGTGTGTVRFGYHVSGSFSQYSRGVSFLVSFNVDADDNLLPGWADLEFLHPLAPAPNCLNCPGGFNGSIDHVFYADYDFTYDTPFLLGSNLSLTQTPCCVEDPDAFQPYPASFLDFGSTVALTEVILPTGATLQSDSGTTYPIVFGLPFAAFAPKAEITLGPLAHDDKFEVKATLTLGASNNGINPLTQAVAVQVGTFSTTIPAGSFKLKKGRFTFEGVINGVKLEAVLRPLILGNDYEFKVEGKGADLTGTANPVTVKLTIGDDNGSKTITAKIK